ncbi:hypothetical protein DFH08DRAFT_938228 [Mycena albidolilacea]|uniref:Uncharacterized protein n=1 Tax=Mycena albidolilacea TaxID=1033008 RepID=A0AAD7ENI4_9AGAR|nr:hypothetical protein DFH08DRAFT_938228 [Mycena albidolilacea]
MVSQLEREKLEMPSSPQYRNNDVQIEVLVRRGKDTEYCKSRHEGRTEGPKNRGIEIERSRVSETRTAGRFKCEKERRRGVADEVESRESRVELRESRAIPPGRVNIQRYARVESWIGLGKGTNAMDASCIELDSITCRRRGGSRKEDGIDHHPHLPHPSQDEAYGRLDSGPELKSEESFVEVGAGCGARWMSGYWVQWMRKKAFSCLFFPYTRLRHPIARPGPGSDAGAGSQDEMRGWQYGARGAGAVVVVAVSVTGGVCDLGCVSGAPAVSLAAGEGRGPARGYGYGYAHEVSRSLARCYRDHTPAAAAGDAGGHGFFLRRPRVLGSLAAGACIARRGCSRVLVLVRVRLPKARVLLVVLVLMHGCYCCWQSRGWRGGCGGRESGSGSGDARGAARADRVEKWGAVESGRNGAGSGGPVDDATGGGGDEEGTPGEGVRRSRADKGGLEGDEGQRRMGRGSRALSVRCGKMRVLDSTRLALEPAPANCVCAHGTRYSRASPGMMRGRRAEYTSARTSATAPASVHGVVGLPSLSYPRHRKRRPPPLSCAFDAARRCVTGVEPDDGRRKPERVRRAPAHAGARAREGRGDRGAPLVEPALEAYEHGEGVIMDLVRVVCGRRDAWLLRWRTHSALMNGA